MIWAGAWGEKPVRLHAATLGGVESVSKLQRSDSFARKTLKLPNNASLAAGITLRVECSEWINSHVRVARGSSRFQGWFEGVGLEREKSEGAGK
jgi:hypothetical protein